MWHARNYVELKSDDPWGWQEYGYAQYMRRQFAAAIECATRAIELDRNLPGARYTRGNSAYELGQWDLVMGDLQMYLQHFPDNEFSRSRLIRAFVASGRIDEAKTQIKALLESNPSNPTRWEQLGQLEFDAGNEDAAFEAFREAIGRTRPETGVVCTSHVSAFVSRYRDEEYHKACQELLKRFNGSTNENTKNGIAWCCAFAPLPKEVVGKAVQLFEPIHAASPSSYAYSNTLGTLLYRVGRVEEAIELLSANIEQHNGGTIFDWLFLAMAYSRSDADEDAQKWLAQSGAWLKARENADTSEGRMPFAWGDALIFDRLAEEAREVVAGSVGANEDTSR